MGTVLYEFLSESLLLRASLVRDNYLGVPEGELERELEAYRAFVLDHLSELREELEREPSHLKVFSGSEAVDVALLKQSLFYTDQHVIDDPLFKVAAAELTRDRSFETAVRSKERGVDRVAVARAGALLRGLTPMVAANFVKLYPVSYHFEPPAEISIKTSETRFREMLPERLLDFFRGRALLESGTQTDTCWRFDGSFEKSRIIGVRFSGDRDDMFFPYLLGRPAGVDPATGAIRLEREAAEAPINDALFTAWCDQSINQAAKRRFDEVVAELTLAAACRASYITRSELVFDMLGLEASAEPSLSEHSATAVLNMEVPFLENVSIETLLSVRQNDGEAFQTFRVELDRQLRELQTVVDPGQRATKLRNVIHELTTVQIHEIDRKVRALRKRALGDTLVAMAAFATATVSGLALPAALLFAANEYRTIQDLRNQMREKPAYFLWKVRRSPGV